jgi:GTP-binding protein
MDGRVKRQEPRVVEASFWAAGTRERDLPPAEGVEVAFAGRSNVGKSTLMNALLGRKSLVRTSKNPGCTRQINLFKARVDDGVSLVLCDLPGYGYAKVAKTESKSWAAMIEGYLEHREAMRAVVLLVDARRGLEADDQELCDFVKSLPKRAGEPVALFVVATKIDKLPSKDVKPAIARIKQATGARVLAVSGAERLGTGELLGALAALARRAGGVAVADELASKAPAE